MEDVPGALEDAAVAGAKSRALSARRAADVEYEMRKAERKAKDLANACLLHWTIANDQALTGFLSPTMVIRMIDELQSARFKLHTLEGNNEFLRQQMERMKI